MSDRPFARAPKHLAGASARISVPVSGIGEEADLMLRYVYSSDYSASDSYIPGVTEQDGYSLLHLTGGIKGLFGSGADLSFYINNLTDKEYTYTGMGFGTTTVNARNAAEPRSYGIALRYTFQ
ncbi:MAG: hypothetical protein ACK5NN_04725 [Sphingomonadaceae bacterium]